ncbi:MAG: hypothetical protein NTY39_09485, partial [Campylobacterales bacterium]|nr:hypothetical protein [Campylobacterales bacterium]
QPYTITNGTVSMSVVSGEETNILLVSSTVLSATELGSISASVTSTEISSGESATTTLSYTTPIMLDMNFDGVHTVSMDQGILFDINADGYTDKVGWSDGIDAFLVHDLNRDGMVNDGRELFGSATTLANGSKAQDGYAALRELDENHDNQINSSDLLYKELSLWIDTNLSGFVDEGEISSLSDAKIASISLLSQTSRENDNGNLIGLKSSYTTAEGKTYAAGDIWLVTASDTTHCENLNAQGSFLSDTAFERIVQQISAYTKDEGLDIRNNDSIQANQAIMNIVSAGWVQ